MTYNQKTNNCTNCGRRIKPKINKIISLFAKEKNIDQDQIDKSGINNFCEKCLKIVATDIKTSTQVRCAECDILFDVTKRTIQYHILRGMYMNKEVIYLLCRECMKNYENNKNI